MQSTSSTHSTVTFGWNSWTKAKQKRQSATSWQRRTIGQKTSVSTISICCQAVLKVKVIAVITVRYSCTLSDEVCCFSPSASEQLKVTWPPHSIKEQNIVTDWHTHTHYFSAAMLTTRTARFGVRNLHVPRSAHTVFCMNQLATRLAGKNSILQGNIFWTVKEKAATWQIS